MPATVCDPDEVNTLRSYLSAGLITADIPAAARWERQLVQAPARVLSITQEGQRTLRRHKHRAMWAVGH
ncbi:MAG: hypothetical protein JWQ03_1937 [Variovorax sp.]|nr:hypothetical protein [Variovorax sp.]